MTPSVAGTFTLVDHNGEMVSEQTFRGRFMLVFFGFTHCKMVCPRALTRLSSALDSLGSLADAICALYITVDPERDTPDVMRAFLEHAYPRFTGLTGTPAQIEAAKKSYRVYSTHIQDPDDPAAYITPHSSFTYLMGPDGQYRAHFTDAVEGAELVRRLESLVGANRPRSSEQGTAMEAAQGTPNIRHGL
jgi:protein SCO1